MIAGNAAQDRSTDASLARARSAGGRGRYREYGDDYRVHDGKHCLLDMCEREPQQAVLGRNKLCEPFLDGNQCVSECSDEQSVSADDTACVASCVRCYVLVDSSEIEHKKCGKTGNVKPYKYACVGQKLVSQFPKR